MHTIVMGALNVHMHGQKTLKCASLCSMYRSRLAPCEAACLSQDEVYTAEQPCSFFLCWSGAGWMLVKSLLGRLANTLACARVVFNKVFQQLAQTDMHRTNLLEACVARAAV